MQQHVKHFYPLRSSHFNTNNIKEIQYIYIKLDARTSHFSINYRKNKSKIYLSKKFANKNIRKIKIIKLKKERTKRKK